MHFYLKIRKNDLGIEPLSLTPTQWGRGCGDPLWERGHGLPTPHYPRGLDPLPTLNYRLSENFLDFEKLS